MRKTKRNDDASRKWVGRILLLTLNFTAIALVSRHQRCFVTLNKQTKSAPLRLNPVFPGTNGATTTRPIPTAPIQWIG